MGEDVKDERDRYRAALEFIAGCNTPEWCREHMKDDHFCALDHKDEVVLAEAVLRAHEALEGKPLPEQSELDILRTIAELAAAWGIAYAGLQMNPCQMWRKKAAEVARKMQTALEAYNQFMLERN